MSVPVYDNIDCYPYFSDSGGNFGSAYGEIQNSGHPAPNTAWLYLERLDVMAGLFDHTGAQVWAWWDPKLIDNTNPLFGTWYTPDSYDLRVCQYDPNSGDQKLYREHHTPPRFREVDIFNPNSIVADDPWPNMGYSSPRTTALGGNGPQPGEEGYWSGVNGEWIFFPGWDKAIVLDCSVEYQGSWFQHVTALIDLDTAFAIVMEDLPCYYNSSPSNEFSRGPLFGYNTTFNRFQFIPDDQSTANLPKGFLFMHGTETDIGSSERMHAFKLVDFNPFDVEGLPNRIHLRERSPSAFIVRQSGYGIYPHGIVRDVNYMTFRYHPPTGMIHGYGTYVAVPPPLQPATALVGMNRIRFSLTPELDSITKPVARNSVETNRIVRYAAECHGDLSENVGGVSVQWSSRRASTVDEVLATTPSVGETVVVNQVPMDAAPAEVVVKKDGTPLVETVDYTLVRSTGSITFLSPHTTAGVYTCTYPHSASPIAPSHGSLVTSYGLSDDDGIVEVRMRYPDDDDLVGQLDEVTVTEL